jgi:tyrosine-specific transport protein
MMIGSSLSPSQAEFMQHANIREIFPSFPLLLTTFGFSIVVPALTEYLNYDEKSAKKSILWGSSIALLAYVVWEWVTLGNIPLKGEYSFQVLKHLGDNGTGVIIALATLSHHPWVVFVGKLFAFLLVISSFLGISLALLHFLSDTLHVSLGGWRRYVLASCMYILPIIVIVLLPRAFVQILSFSGIFVAVLLGFFPALMVYTLRKKKLIASSDDTPLSLKISQQWYIIGLVCLFFALVIVQEIINLNQ